MYKKNNQLEELLDKYVPKLIQVNVDGPRYYKVAGIDKKFVSATSFLSAIKDDSSWLDAWRQRVGNDEADRIVNLSTSFGTAMHAGIEYLLKDGLLVDLSEFLSDCLNKDLEGANKININEILLSTMVATTEMVETINNNFKEISLLEQKVFSEAFGIAGTLDALGISNANECTLIDFKNSKSAKKETYIENYFIQAFIYAIALRQMLETYIKPNVNDIEWENIKRKYYPTRFMIICYNRADGEKYTHPHVQLFSGSLSDIKNSFINAYSKWQTR